jgi:hypothetical protein
MLCLKETAYDTQSVDTETKTLMIPVEKRKSFASTCRSFAIVGPGCLERTVVQQLTAIFDIIKHFILQLRFINVVYIGLFFPS